MDTLKKIKEIISQQTGADKDSLSENTTMEDIMADSLDVVELLMTIEESFDVEISDAEAEKLCNLGELSAIVESKLLM